MRGWVLASLWLGVASSACGGAVASESVSTSSATHDARFMGTWMIADAEPHALFFAAVYDFRADGTLVLVKESGFSGRPVRVGGVQRGDVDCSLGDHWRSEGPTVLHVEGKCNDGAVREIVLDWPEDRSQNSAAGEPYRIASVGGEPGWAPNNAWGWRMTRCADVAVCTRGWR